MIALRFFGHVAAALGALCLAVWLVSLVTGAAVVADPDDKRVPIAFVICTLYGTVRTMLHYMGARDHEGQQATPRPSTQEKAVLASAETFYRGLWVDEINPMHDRESLTEWATSANEDPEGPFADAGQAVGRLLELGAAPRDIALIQRCSAFGAVLGVLAKVSKGEVPTLPSDFGDLGLALLDSDPSGLSGTMGSAPE